MALVSYLIAPVEASPHYGLDHEFCVDDDEFLPTMAGATGVPFLPGNRIDHPEQRRRVLPGDARGDRAAPRRRSRSRPTSTGPARSAWQFAERSPRGPQAGVTVKILLDAVGSATIGDDILKILEAGGCQLAWYNPIALVHARPLQPPHPSQVAHRRRPDRASPAAPASPTTGAASAQDPGALARHADPDRGARRSMPLQTGFAQNWLQTTGELISGRLYLPADDPAGHAGGADDHELAGNRRLAPCGSCTTCRSSARGDRSASPTPTSCPTQVGHRRAGRGAGARGVDVRVMVSGIHNDNWLARQNSVRLFGRLLEAGVEILEYNRTMLHHKTMVVDGVWATIGTTNFDNRSFAHNEENNVCVYDAGWRGSCTIRSSATRKAASGSTCRPGAAAASGAARRKWSRRSSKSRSDLRGARREARIWESIRSTSCTSRGGRSTRRADRASRARSTCSRDR